MNETTLFQEHLRAECRWCARNDATVVKGDPRLWIRDENDGDYKWQHTLGDCAVQTSEVQWLETRVQELRYRLRAWDDVHAESTRLKDDEVDRLWAEVETLQTKVASLRRWT